MAERVINLQVRVEDGKVRIDPHDVVVTRQPTLLHFQLLTPGYQFPLNFAIEVTDPGCDFPYSSWTLQSARGEPSTAFAANAVLFDANLQSGKFAYTVNVVKDSSERIFSSDPTIENQAK